jgi:hypothetical protein
MSLLKLNDITLGQVEALIRDPSKALPLALKELAPSTAWDLLTQKVGSNLVKTDEVELALPLLDKSATQDGALSGDWTWSASVEANASLAMDLLSDEDLGALTIRPDTGHTLIVYGGSLAVGGKLGAHADSLPWGKVGIEAHGQRSADVRWYVQAKDDATLLDALLSAKRHFVWPHDIQGMLRMAGRTDWHGLTTELTGEAQLSIDVDAAVQGTGWTFTMNGESASVGLSFGIKAGFKASRSSRWELSAMVEPFAPPGSAPALGLRIKLHDLKQSSRSASAELRAGADFSAVTTAAERVLRAAWPDLPKSKLLDALTQPGTAIADQLRSLVDKKLDGPLQQIASVLVGGKPTDELRGSLVDKLTSGLVDVLDGALGDLANAQANVDKALARWLNQVLGKAADSLTVDDDIKAFVSDALKQGTAGVENAITGLKAQLVNKTQAEVDALLKPLGELGAQFDKSFSRLNDNAASAAIRGALQRYADLRDKLLAAITDAHRQKVMLTIGGSFTQDTAREVAFEAWFRPDDTMTPEAERLFNALYGGGLLALPELVQAATVKGAVADVKGWLMSTRQTLEKQRVTLNFFGVEIGSSSTWLRDVSVKADLVTGNLSGVAKALVETAIFNPWKNRSARLGVQLELIGADRASRQVAASLDGAFTASKENTDTRTVQDLLNAYADATGAQRTNIGTLLTIPAADDAARRFWKSMTIAVPVALDAQAWGKFSRLDEATIERVSVEIALAQFQRRYLSDSLFSDDPVQDLRDLIQSVTAAKRADNATIMGYLKLFPVDYVNSFSAAREARKIGIDAVDSQLHDRGARRFMAYHRLSATVQAPLRLRAAAVEATSQLLALPEHPDPVVAREILDPIMRRMQKALAPVALVSETWLGIGILGAKDEPIAWPFASFITSMATLAGLNVPPGFVPVAQTGDQPPVKLLG